LLSPFETPVYFRSGLRGGRNSSGHIPDSPSNMAGLSKKLNKKDFLCNKLVKMDFMMANFWTAVSVCCAKIQPNGRANQRFLN
jgi:hypothetical protein